VTAATRSHWPIRATGRESGRAGERVVAPEDLGAALERGIRTTRDGSPYLVEVVVAAVGGGADSTWHQRFNLAAKRTRRL